MTTETETTPRQKLEALITELGLTMAAEFVPFSKSRNAQPREDGKPWRSLNWRVTLQRQQRHDERARAILTTDYSQGEAHCPAYKASVAAFGARGSVLRYNAISHEIETGRTMMRSSVSFAPGKAIAPPDLCDVLHSLVSDADVLDCSTFEEWASNYGYDAESRKAEATYRACLESALKLRNGLGEANLQRLRDAAQDY